MIDEGPISTSSLRERIGSGLVSYSFDQHRRYPAASEDGWMNFFFHKLTKMQGDRDTSLLWDEDGYGTCLVAAKVSKWDTEHFGFPMGNLRVVYRSQSSRSVLERVCRSAIRVLADHHVQFISARVHGDDLEAIHFLESIGFRYFENIIWPVVSTYRAGSVPAAIRLLEHRDLDTVASIARDSQFQRGHYHCDPNFVLSRVDELYAKWVRSAYERGQPILVTEAGGPVVGYFVLELTEDLSQSLGHRYGGMRSLGVSRHARGRGYGATLFRGAIAWMKAAGIEFVDSGYATKNHLSARLHVEAGFRPVYEEVTLHLWLRQPQNEIR